jgi:hypothetical protein
VGCFTLPFLFYELILNDVVTWILDKMSSADTVRANYAMSRQELVQRVQMRDNALMAFLAVTGTVYGVSLGTAANTEILLIIPYLGMGCAVLVSQHNSVIGALLEFNTHEVKKFLENLSPSEYAPQFDSSKAFKKHSKRSNRLRTFGHLVIIVIPSVFALLYNIKLSFSSDVFKLLSWWFAAICTGIAIWIIWYIYGYRMRVYNETDWDKATP